jgi:hypothetical protein
MTGLRTDGDWLCGDLPSPCRSAILASVTGVGIACCLIPGTLVELSAFRPHELLRQNGLASVPQYFDHPI